VLHNYLSFCFVAEELYCSKQRITIIIVVAVTGTMDTICLEYCFLMLLVPLKVLLFSLR